VELNVNDGKKMRVTDIVLVIFIGLVLFAPSLFVRDLWTPDEPRYMEVAREMASTGNYLVPHLNGYLYPDKPPLFFWLAAGLYKTGFGLKSGRIVSGTAALITALIVLVFASRKIGRNGALIVSAMTMTSILFMEAKAGVIDPLLMLFSTACVLSGYTALQPSTSRRAAWWMACYSLAGIAILTKGPVALLPPLLALVPYAILNRRNLASGVRVHGLGIVVLLAIALSWFIPMTMAAGPEYREHVVRQIFGRVVNSYSHRAPFYYYIKMAPLNFFPWFLLLIPALAWAARSWRRSGNDFGLFAFLWFALSFIAFSIISGKRQGYLMPILPAAGLMMGAYMNSVATREFPWPRLHDWLARITLAIFILISVAAVAIYLSLTKTIVSHVRGAGNFTAEIAKFERPSVLAIILILAVIFSALAATGIAISRRNRRLPFFAIVAIMVLASFICDVCLAPQINRFKSPRNFTDGIHSTLAHASGIYILKNDMDGVYNVYTKINHMRELRSTDEILRVLALGEKAAIITNNRNRRRLIGDDFAGCLAIFKSAGVGSDQMELLINWNPETGNLLGPPPCEFQTVPDAPKRR